MVIEVVASSSSSAAVVVEVVATVVVVLVILQTLSSNAPDLAPCEFWLFLILKDRLAGRKFDRIQDLAKAVNSELRTIPEEGYQSVFQKWQTRLKRCI
ncbi:transposase [Elysia marginata]|uniref:Transposase n=1 Tax=Elysia marginata TaxID=1093978 RepID=A0AAV4FPJ9_9GAST|nr:transposase [Elysia marginata]